MVILVWEFEVILGFGNEWYEISAEYNDKNASM